MLQTLHNSKYAFFRVSVIAIVLGFFAFLGLQACLATTKHTLLLILYFSSSLEIFHFLQRQKTYFIFKQTKSSVKSLSEERTAQIKCNTAGKTSCFETHCISKLSS